jgi:hypothetical protein
MSETGDIRADGDKIEIFDGTSWHPVATDILPEPDAIHDLGSAGRILTTDGTGSIEWVAPPDATEIFIHGRGGAGGGVSSGDITIRTGSSAGGAGGIAPLDPRGMIDPKILEQLQPLNLAPDANQVEIIDGEEIILNGMKIPKIINFKVEKTHSNNGRVTLEFDADVKIISSEEKSAETAKDFMKELKNL